MNYLIPVYRALEKPDLEYIKYKKEYLDTILDQQILISQMSQGITYQDTENMDEYERTYIISKLIQMKKDEIEAKEKAYEEINRNAKNK